ncbi:MAG TPA: hypothetical protein PLF91_13310, partial [Mycolicibacterium fallax]|nr:hypothetical protein [Mycolicibacterium fallax]
EALSLARRLGGGPAAAVIAGKGVAGLAKDLGPYGAGTVYVADRRGIMALSGAGAEAGQQLWTEVRPLMIDGAVPVLPG